MTIINENKLREVIRKITLEEIDKAFPHNQISSLWSYLNELSDKIKCLEGQKMMTKEEAEVDEYLHEGYDRKRDDDAEKDFELIEKRVKEEELKECEFCGDAFAEEEMDLVDGEWICRECENKMEVLKGEEDGD